ncbi:tyrosine-type recombinase/integrase [Vibrio coralliilyticus]|uniref:tyrosine-type recombinase/integrase n=1 Tax=Vibrio coralliilyticus TaxID=190893 RepID=UPI000BAC14EC|nr:tyrosine-type recombinase/integrase [Vibrio coralliilyticus]NOI75010.1 tyrosine-type recombinase/integrase [Vibrio coralliilyticus]PAW05588.1 integrase [Vibrio coralliilyticus]
MKKNIRAITDLATRNRFIRQFTQCVTIDTMNSLTDSQYSNNSLLALTKDWNLFSEYCQKKSVNALPASTAAVRLFLERESRQRKYSTLRRYVVTISLVHRVLEMSDPTAHSSVQQSLAALRIEKSGDAHPTVPFERKHLEALTEKLDNNPSLKVVRDLAIYHLMFECMLKRNELKNMSPADIEKNNDGFIVNIGTSSYPLSLHGQKYLLRWLSKLPVQNPYLFSAIDKHGNIGVEPLNDSSIYRILRAASDKLKLNVKFSGQSLRVGAVKELSRKGVKAIDIQHYGRWLSPAMPYQYLGNKVIAEAEMMVFKRFKPWD